MNDNINGQYNSRINECNSLIVCILIWRAICELTGTKRVDSSSHLPENLVSSFLFSCMIMTHGKVSSSRNKTILFYHQSSGTHGWSHLYTNRKGRIWLVPWCLENGSYLHLYSGGPENYFTIRRYFILIVYEKTWILHFYYFFPHFCDNSD